MLEHQRVAVILIDDASRDDTVGIAHTLGSHIILHLGEEHWHFALARIDHQACGN